MPTTPTEIAGRQIGIPTTRRFRERCEPFFWPLVGDYPLYDRYIYAVMTADDERATAYHEAIRTGYSQADARDYAEAEADRIRREIR